MLEKTFTSIQYTANQHVSRKLVQQGNKFYGQLTVEDLPKWTLSVPKIYFHDKFHLTVHFSY